MNFSFLAAAICEKDEIWGFKQSIQVWYMVQNHCMNIIHQICVVMPYNLWEPVALFEVSSNSVGVVAVKSCQDACLYLFIKKTQQFCAP
jgi:hypothetical protein